MATTVSGGLSDTTVADQDRDQQEQPQDPSGTVSAPDPRRLSEGGQDLLALQRDLTRSLGQTYQDPQAAYQNLTQDGEQRISNEDLRQQPQLLGPLREGANPDERTMNTYIAGRDSHDQAAPQAQQEVSAYSQQEGAYRAQEQTRGEMRSQSQTQSQSQGQAANNGQDDKTVAGGINKSLNGIMSSQQSLSI